MLIIEKDIYSLLHQFYSVTLELNSYSQLVSYLLFSTVIILFHSSKILIINLLPQLLIYQDQPNQYSDKVRFISLIFLLFDQFNYFMKVMKLAVIVRHVVSHHFNS